MTALVSGAIALALGVSSAAAQDVTKCQRTLMKEAAKVEAKRAKALRKCYDVALKDGTASPTCPDPDNQAKIDAAVAKMQDKVGDDCSGVTLGDLGFSGLVKRCAAGTNNGGLCAVDNDCPDPPNPPATCTAVDECPDLYNGNLTASCEALLSDGVSVGDCLVCNGNNMVREPMRIAYNHVVVPLPSIEAAPGDVLKCQRNVGKSTAKYFAKVRKALSKCKDAVIKSGSGSCPDPDASSKISDALAKFTEKVEKDCTGTTYPNGLDRADILDSIVVPFGNVPPVDSLGSYEDVLTGTVGQVTACSSELATGAFATGCQPLCGNGKIDAGETCDDGNQVNGDSCPNDCNIVSCSDGGDVTAIVNFSPPAGVDLTAVQVLIGYPDDLVRIPGSGNQTQVLDRVAANDGTASLAVNDLNYAIRLLVNTDGTVAITGGPGLASIDFDTCTGAPAPGDGDFTCVVTATSAFGPVADVVYATTCSVDVP